MKHKKMKASDHEAEEKSMTMKPSGMKMPKNVWMYTSIVLAVLILVLVVAKDNICGAPAASGATTGNVVGEMQDEFIFLYSDACTTPCTELLPVAQDVADKAGLVFRKIKYPQPIEVPGYFLLTGADSTAPAVIQDKNSLLVSVCEQTDNEDICAEAVTAKAALEAEAEAAAEEELASVAKADKPKVEVFVMSYCPYGTQIEKGILPVAELLGDKIDFEIKFVNYAMHGEKELVEQTLQYCIQKEQNALFNSYLSCFLGEGDTDACLAEAGVDQAKLDSCIDATEAEYKTMEMFADQSTWLSGRYPVYPIYDAENTEYGVRGSPSLVINGQMQSSARDPASLLKTVCAGFTTAPSECSTQLSTSAPSPGFGYEGTGSNTAAQCG